ncbi:IS110 family transposase [Agaribacterium sp. ZY112]|uniref:IS110 family transposase n=1 Tax=Agaribacterium sp. ZY112 TaxID=3233574 RepID=UPI003523D24E
MLAHRTYAKTYRSFFDQHNSRYQDINEQRIEAIKQIMPLTHDKDIIEPNEIIIEMLASQLKHLIESILRLDKEIQTRYRKMDDRNLFDSFPGAGPQLAPRLLTAFGSNRDRYKSAAELQQYARIAPVIEQSGKKSWTHWRYSCPTFIRQTFVEWAGQSVRFSYWAKACSDKEQAAN